MGPEATLAEYGAAWERGDPEAAWAFYADDVEVVNGKIADIDIFEANQYEVDEFFT